MEKSVFFIVKTTGIKKNRNFEKKSSCIIFWNNADIILQRKRKPYTSNKAKKDEL